MSTRKLIRSNETKISIIQMIGFIIIAIGIITIGISALLNNSSIIAVSFFIIMLGIAFAFPTLLEGNEGLSTMRIVVFMVTNVICILLIRIGWGKDSLANIGLDQWWMGVIAFVFGAKATQSYFESKLAVPQVRSNTIDDITKLKTIKHYDELSESEQYSIVQEYIDSNIDKLLQEFPAITGVYAGKKKIEGKEIDLISLVIQVETKSNSSVPFPEFFEYGKYRIPTDIEVANRAIANSSDSNLNYGVSRMKNREFGTLGFPVYFKEEIYILSCFHVFFNLELKGGKQKVVGTDDIGNRKIFSPPFLESGEDYIEIGEVVAGEISNFLDIAIMKPNPVFLSKIQRLHQLNEYRTLAREHQGKIFLRFWGKGSNRNVTSKLVNISSVQQISYLGIGDITLKGLIQMEKCSIGGDSGATVYDLSGNLIGLIIGSDSLYTYAISAYNIFDKSEYNIKRNAS